VRTSNVRQKQVINESRCIYSWINCTQYPLKRLYSFLENSRYANEQKHLQWSCRELNHGHTPYKLWDCILTVKMVTLPQCGNEWGLLLVHQRRHGPKPELHNLPQITKKANGITHS
jgi:hypothetical protein